MKLGKTTFLDSLGFGLARGSTKSIQLFSVEPVLVIQWTAIGLLLVKAVAELILDKMNAAHVRRHASQVPDGFERIMSPEVYAKSVDYTLAKNRISQFTNPYDLAVILLILFSGLLPWAQTAVSGVLGDSVWATATFLIGFSLVLSFVNLPWDWHNQFRLEERFGFNKTTIGLWISDRVKGMALALVIGVPLVSALLKLVDIGGDLWWAYAWVTVILFQIVMMIVAPMWILPLFNKLEPLEEGDLKKRLLKLGEATGFSASTILVMDGSKRSSHSNAFFTGFGRFRKIVLFDTLIEQLSIEELEAVLAHEIGHFKKKHVLKLLAWSCLTLLASFWVLSLIIRYQPFFSAFGFSTTENAGIAFLLFGILSGAVTFWTTPLSSAWSRKFEYEADAFAAQAVGSGKPLVSSLKKLSEKNLSNLTPHPVYSSFYYSHPTLLERSQALD